MALLHAPMLDNEIGTMSLPLAAAACLIGAWFRDSTEWTERLYALRVHGVLSSAYYTAWSVPHSSGR